MVEHSTETVGLAQLGKATIETFPIWFQNRDTFLPSSALTLVQLRASFPQETNTALQNEEKAVRLFSYFMYLGVDMNDWIDCETLPEQKVLAFDEWRTVNRLLKQEDSESQKLALSYQRETLFIERHYQNNPPKTVQEACTYRELVNAIALLHISSLILNSKETEMSPLSTITYDILSAKYKWLLDADPKNTTQSRLIGMFNAVMAIQAIDDYLDYERDSAMNITSIATVAGQILDPQEVSGVCHSLKKHYNKKAAEFGVSKGVLYANSTFFTTMKKLMELRPNTFGGRRERSVNSQPLNQQ